MPHPKQQARALGLLLVMLAAFLGLSWRLAYLQVFKHEEFADRAEAARQRVQILPARRGSIFDRNGALLATCVPVKTVFLDAQAWGESPPSVERRQRLIQLLALDPRDFEERLATGRRYLVLRRKVPETTVAQLRELKIRAVGMEEDFQRRYPLGRSLCHVLGFTDFELRGAQGVERMMEAYLSGQAGWRVYSRDNKGREIVAWRQEEIPPRDGYHVELTIDAVIQDIAEQELAAAGEAHRPLNACAIVMRPQTGELLALANWPTYDPQQPGGDPIENQKNVAILNLIEPGSTMKIFAVAGALNDGTVRPSDTFFCENGIFFYGGKRLRDTHPHGTLTVEQIIQKSSNIGAAKIALQMGPQRLAHYINAFGFGQRTEIGLPAETAGIVHPVSRWSKLSITRIPIGQEIAITPIQLIRAASALANGGEMMQPHLIRRIVTSDGVVIAQVYPRLVHRPILPRAAAQMNEMLKLVASEEGTARKAMLKDWRVAGKTGTSQKYQDGQPSHTKYVASFVGYLPADRPQLCILVVLDEPKGGYYGGDVAAPVFRRIAERAAAYLSIPADMPSQAAQPQPDSRTNATANPA